MKKSLITLGLFGLCSFSSMACTEENVQQLTIESLEKTHNEIRNVKMGMFQDLLENVYKVIVTYESLDVMPTGEVFDMEMGASFEVDLATCKITDEYGISIAPVTK